MTNFKSNITTRPLVLSWGSLDVGSCSVFQPGGGFQGETSRSWLVTLTLSQTGNSYDPRMRLKLHILPIPSHASPL